MTKYITYKVTVKAKDADDFRSYLDNFPFWIEHGWYAEFEGSD